MPLPTARASPRTAGNLTVTVVPLPTSLAIESLPPCSSTSDFEMARPRPEPPLVLVNWFSTCSKGRPSFSMSLGGMPMPVSAIVIYGIFAVERRPTSVTLPALRRELHRIGDEVDEHLLERRACRHRPSSFFGAWQTISTLPS